MDTLQRLLRLDTYTRDTRRRRALYLYGVLSAMLLMFVVYAFTIDDWGLPIENQPYTLVEYTAETAIAYFILFGTITAGLIGLYFTYHRQLNNAAWFPPIMWLIIGGISTLAGPGNFSTPNSIAALGSFIVLGGFFKDQLGAVVTTIIAVLLVLLDWPANTGGMATTAVLLIGTGAISYLFAQYVQFSRTEGVSSAAAERLKLATLNTEITRLASERTELDNALNKLLSLILENYPALYHAQVFLLDDEGVDAKLRASTGETGQALIEKGHSLAVGSLSVIGQTTLKGEHVIARSESRNSVHRHNELLPETRLEAAFPLRVEDKIIGALDLQSREDLDLSEEDIRSFQTLANTLSLAIDNIRQFEMSRMRVRENQKLAEQARNALREVERLNQRLIGRAWSEYLGGKEQAMGLNIDFEADTSERDTRWTPSLADAMDSNNIVQDGQTVAIPLRVRGRVIGAMEFELTDEDDFDPDDLELVQEISERFGLAAENTRLVEESQRMAQREALINELSSRFQSARDVEATLAEAARSLSETFMAERVSIRLGVPETPNRSNGNKG